MKRRILSVVNRCLAPCDAIVVRKSTLEKERAALQSKAENEPAPQPAVDDPPKPAASVPRHRSTDLVDFGELKIFMYMDDLAYELVPASRRYYQLTTPDRRRLAREKPLADEVSAQAFLAEHVLTDPILAVFDHYWRHNLDFTFIDVGCQYGTGALFAALRMRQAGRCNPVVCFEPGDASELVPHNIALNALGSQVRHERAAVCDFHGPMLMYSEQGRSENNRIVNRDPRSEFSAYVVNATSLDHYVHQAGISNHLVVKIDTQGAEYRVLRGMKTIRSERLVTFVIEFTPHALRSDVEPHELLAALCQTSFVIDLDIMRDKRPKLIDPSQCREFAQQIADTPAGWTDLLVIPRDLPDAETLVSQVVDGCVPAEV